MPRVEVSKRIKEALSGLVKAPGDLVDSTLRVTRDVTMNALRGTSQKPEVSRQVAEGAVEGAISAGSEAGADLGSVAKEAMIGTVQGVSEVSKVDRSMISSTARAAITRTGKVGGDIVAVARKVVEGATEAGDRIGLGAEDATTAAIAGVMEAAEGISRATAEAVAKGLSVAFAGVRIAFGLPPKKPAILMLDADQSSLGAISQQLLKEGYDALGVSNLEGLDDAIKGPKNIALAVIDLTGFDQRIWERCQELRKTKTPFIIISPQRSPTIQRDSMRHGASGLLVKPVGTKELMEYIRTLLGE